MRVLVAAELFTKARSYANHPTLEKTASHPKIFTDHEDTLFSLLLTDEASEIFDRTEKRQYAMRVLQHVLIKTGLQ
jgi:hypothetical protein